MNCKVCGKRAESNFCFLHKPRKALAQNRMKKNPEDKGDSNPMQEFFLGIWKKREHKCEDCKKWLGNEPLSYMFDHILEKEKYPYLKYEENNICIVCLECHDNKTRGNLSEFFINKIKKAKEIFLNAK